jgi:hypothetical protein
MKNILFVFLFFSASIFAQQNDKKWAKAITYENEGKIKSAHKVVAKIYKKAVAKKDEVQMIKCFFYQSKYIQILDEDAKDKIIANLKTDINRVSTPSKAILNLIYAKYLKDYLNYGEPYSMVDSTAVAVDYATTVVDSAAALIDEAVAQIDTAAAVIDTAYASIDSVAVSQSDYIPTETISENDVIAAFEKTLENEAILKTTPLINYKLVFNFPVLEKFKKENLFHYLLQENIDFYTEKIQQWTIQDIDFINQRNELLGDSESFLKLSLDFIKEENVKKVLSLYQKKEGNNPSIENQFERAKFCYNYLLKSDENFNTFLDQFEKETQDKNLIQDIKLQKAEILIEKASKELYPNNNIEALKIIDEIIKIDDNTNTSKLASFKKREILSKFLSVQLQKNSYQN